MDEKEQFALWAFYEKEGKCRGISDEKFLLQRWAQLGLPNGQITRCAWKEIENQATHNSRNVKVHIFTHEFIEGIKHVYSLSWMASSILVKYNTTSRPTCE